MFSSAVVGEEREQGEHQSLLYGYVKSPEYPHMPELACIFVLTPSSIRLSAL